MKMKKLVTMVCAVAMMFGSISGNMTVQSAAKAKLKTKKITITVGEKKKIVIKNKKKKAVYTFVSSNKKKASVSNKGIVTGKKRGSAKIMVNEKYKGKKRKIGTVTVRIEKEESIQPTKKPVVTETPTEAPTESPTEAPTAKPTATPKPKATIPPDYAPPSDYTKKKSDTDYGIKEGFYYHSTTTEVSRHAYVVLPPNYSEEKEYPVLYLLHGIGGDENEWFSGRPMEILGNLYASGEAKEMIMVFPNVRCREDDTACYELTPEHFQAFDNFINDLRDNLMPYVEKTYSVAKGRENTAIAGLSMGGRESLYIGLSMPETFGYIGAFEPAVGVLPYHTEGGLFTEETMTLPNEYKENTMLMIVKGQNDGTVGENPKLYHDTLLKNGVDHIYYDMPGGHDFSVWNNGLYNFAKRIF